MKLNIKTAQKRLRALEQKLESGEYESVDALIADMRPDYVELGTRAAERELQTLKIIADYKDEKTCPVWEIERIFSEELGKRFWMHQIHLIADDLQQYGLISIEGKDGWYRYRLTEKGRQFVEEWVAESET